jgi:hypothetical protein
MALLIILAVVLLFTLPMWPYARPWGFVPSGVITLILVLVIVLILLGIISWGGPMPLGWEPGKS